MIIDTLTSPVILFFLLGFFAAFAKSDLSIPEAFGKAMSIYLMVAIGLKGGVEVMNAGFSIDLLNAALAGLSLSFLLPVPAFFALIYFGKLKPVDAGAVAAHYGSVSVVTFVTAKELLTNQGLEPAGYMVAVLAIMETPAIISGLLLIRFGNKGKSTEKSNNNIKKLLHEVFTNASVILLIGAFIIGMVAGKSGFEPIKPLFEVGFKGVLCLFLLDMGLVAGRRLVQSNKLSLRLVMIGICLPIFNGTFGAIIGLGIGLDAGSAIALSILGASASYIAVPAAMRLAAPEADPGIYLTMSLGVTFPFNIIIGISLYTYIVQILG
ncbi:sodium-dependent bicarbonate transport family permease [Sphingorhabdus lutea]|uniref:Sodium-dependent bicarbonate transport family permease n=1 Tax=Sphingorhabdus lutea TaxID=1913578 RepID=A0A1L3JEY4_9SPHN|nr:sodium-dependent bicarbonate transport family permease [Sphingorhabdus lutea]APG63697.1 sodium-dependent bicarbonate transport family permease [Sphingorhabdus lutea]